MVSKSALAFREFAKRLFSLDENGSLKKGVSSRGKMLDFSFPCRYNGTVQKFRASASASAIGLCPVNHKENIHVERNRKSVFCL